MLRPWSTSNYSNSEHQCGLLILQRSARKSGHRHVALLETSEVGTDWHLYYLFNSAWYTFCFIYCHFDLSPLEERSPLFIRQFTQLQLTCLLCLHNDIMRLVHVTSTLTCKKANWQIAGMSMSTEESNVLAPSSNFYTWARGLILEQETFPLPLNLQISALSHIQEI